MSSIRLFLTISIISTMILANFLAALQGYQESMQEAEKLFDRKLEYFSDFLATRILNTNLPVQHDLSIEAPLSVNLEISTPDVILYQVRSEKGTVLFQSTGFENHLTHEEEAKFGNALNFKLEVNNDYVNYAGFRWRSITRYYPKESRWVFVMEKQDVRYGMAESVILESIYPIVFSIPTIGVIIFFIVRRGLKPVANLANKVDAKQAGNLTPIEIDNVPVELNRLVERINELLVRLDNSLLREKRFASDAAHELRTPIAALNIQMKNLTEEDEKSKKNIEELEKGVKRMSHLVEQILMLNRSSPDLYAEQFKKINLSTLLKELVVELYPLIEEKKHEVDFFDNNLEVEKYILGDLFALQTMFKNLILNAIKYTPVGGSIIIILDEDVCTTEKIKEKIVTVSILDSGPGIPIQERVRIFERFYRVAGDRNQSAVIGCGLGLAIVKQIIELHQAIIELSDSTSHIQKEVHFDSGLCVKLSFSKYVGSHT